MGEPGVEERAQHTALRCAGVERAPANNVGFYLPAWMVV